MNVSLEKMFKPGNHQKETDNYGLVRNYNDTTPRQTYEVYPGNKTIKLPLVSEGSFVKGWDPDTEINLFVLGLKNSMRKGAYKDSSEFS